MRKPLSELYEFNKVLCCSCGVNCDLLFNSDLDCYYCQDCLDNETEEYEPEPTYNELCAERNGGYKL